MRGTGWWNAVGLSLVLAAVVWLSAPAVAQVAPGPASGAVPPAAALAAPADPAPLKLDAPSDPSDRRRYIDIVRREATSRGLPPEVAEAVAYVESGFSPSAVGGVGEIGLMQIRPATAEMLGHDGGALALFDPEVNARFAVRYLAGAWRLADGDLCRALMKYRAGHGSEIMSPLSVRYCERAKSYLATLGSPLADGATPVATTIRDLPGDMTKVAKRAKFTPYLGWRPGKHTPADNARFWSRHEARIKAIEARIEKRWKTRMARR